MPTKKQARMSMTKAELERFNQNGFLDGIADGRIETQSAGNALRPSALSLHPGEILSLAVISGSEQAIVIRDAWRWSAPVTIMAAEDFDRMIENNHMVFTGRMGDLHE